MNMKTRMLLLLFLTLILGVWLARLLMLQQLSFTLLGCRTCVLPHVIQADIFYWAAIITFLTLSLLQIACPWRLFWRGLGLVGIWLYVTDLLVMKQFGTRLMLADIKVYLTDVKVIMTMIPQWPLWQVLVAVSAFGISLFLWLLPIARPLQRRAATILLFGVLALAGLGHLFVSPSTYVHEWAVRNILAANLPTGVSTDYSTASLARLEASLPAQECVNGRAQRSNVLVLILESWSTYHSLHWLGQNNWTPHLDALAKQGVWFNQLYAGGFNTNEGLVSILTGRDIVLPTLPPHQMKAFEGAWNVQGALPQQLHALGYQTTFMTSGNLAYTRKGEWLRQIGFDNTLGHDISAFEGLPRGHFDAVADEVLYDVARSHLRQQRHSEQPVFMVIENVSSHHPFIHPVTGERSEEAVFRYMDKAAGDFIAQLLMDGFLENGLIFVISDHRAMTFVTPEEQRQFGRSAVSRIPGFVLMGHDRSPQRVDQPMHQADLLPTLLRQVSEKYCMTIPRRDFLAPGETQARCLLHARGDRRDHVDIYCPDGTGTVEVDGDNSQLIHTMGLEENQHQYMLDIIARQRLGLMPKAQVYQSPKVSAARFSE